MMEKYEQYYIINTSRGYISRFRYFGEEFTVNISEAEKYYSKSDAEYYVKCCVKPEFNPQIMRVTCKYTVLYEEE